jgi:hypothetical protein
MGRTCIRISGSFALLLAATAAMAWDAGPRQCVHDVCSGGVDANSFADTQPAFADSVIPGRLADCPPGYSNLGIAGCGRGADSISTPSQLASCPAGYKNMGLTCFRGVDTYAKKCLSGGCNAGYRNMGCFCARGADTLLASAMTCPAGYFKDDVVQRCHKNCGAGYTQMGESCFRGVSTEGPSAFRCKPGEHLGGGLNANKCFPTPGPCSADREEYGVSGAALCFKKCPAGSHRTAVSTCTHDVKWRGNTHLYVVQGALALLRASSDPVAASAVKTMTTEPCKSSWEQGLWDADDPNGNLLDNPSDSSKGGGTHFYNASLKDAWGKPTSTVTYLLAGRQVNFKGNARTNAAKYVVEAGDMTRSPTAAQCHALGLALHFETDMTQPMHATAFSALEIPVMLHAALEEYVPTIQARYPPSGSWDQRWKGMKPDDVLQQTSLKSGSLSPAFMQPMDYKGTICTMNPETGAVYTGMCFAGVPAVDAAVGVVLREGYQSTASYIYSVFKR